MSILREDVEAGRVDFSDLIDPDAAPLDPVHPGNILLHEFLEPLEMTPELLAGFLRVPAERVMSIMRCEAGVDGDMALRLARYFGMPVEFWLGLQMDYEKDVARLRAEQIAREVQPRAA